MDSFRRQSDLFFGFSQGRLFGIGVISFGTPARKTDLPWVIGKVLNRTVPGLAFCVTPMLQPSADSTGY
tara:strand:+ start:1538 stop:1744 length:207 start_codon:yes stop_codon:yes gene_type:complete